jgi:hypothetical protein
MGQGSENLGPKTRSGNKDDTKLAGNAIGPRSYSRTFFSAVDSQLCFDGRYS